jgi:hypothetical protein
MIALPCILDQASVGPFAAALLRTPDGFRIHLADTRTGQDAWLASDGAQTLAGILALHPFPMSVVSLGDGAVACPTPQAVEVVQGDLRLGIPAQAAFSVHLLLEDLERTRLLFHNDA